MYEEEKKNSFIKDFIIKLLYMFLFLFLFMWLYPAPKVDLKDVKVKVDKTELEPLFAGIFNDNINAMKESARSYYTIDRLPKNNGDSTKMTLQEMLNKKMVAPFVDANGKSCNASTSYVEVTRISSTEYTMKVNLECSDKKDYIIETIGCTSVCPGCVAAPTPVATKTVSGSTATKTVVYQPTPVTPSNPVTPSTPSSKTYVYTKNIENWETNNTWTTEKKTGSDVRVYDTRTVTGNPTYETRSYTYRTVSWVASWDPTSNYTLVLNNNTIPYDAQRVRITSQSIMTSDYELNRYKARRYSCDIRMDGYNCPQPYDEAIIQDRNLLSTPRANFTYNLGIYKSQNAWKVSVNTSIRNSFYGDQQYIVPIKFIVSWDEKVEGERIKEYKYQYLTVTTDTKYSSSKNDVNLLNAGYKFVGEK